MALEYRERGPSTPGTFDVVMTECPICGHEFRAHESRPQHIRREHDAEDVPALRGGVDA